MSQDFHLSIKHRSTNLCVHKYAHVYCIYMHDLRILLYVVYTYTHFYHKNKNLNNFFWFYLPVTHKILTLCVLCVLEGVWYLSRLLCFRGNNKRNKYEAKKKRLRTSIYNVYTRIMRIGGLTEEAKLYSVYTWVMWLLSFPFSRLICTCRE